jgi:hypothetical protein
MSLEALADFFFTAPPAVVRLEMIELRHSDLSQTYYMCSNSDPRFPSITVTQEDDGSVQYQYVSMLIKTLGTASSLDQEMEITIGDVGQILPQEIENISNENGFEEKPIIRYREYRSDDLSQELFGPIDLEVNSIAFNKTGCVFKAKPPAWNRGRVGEVYDPGRFPPLKAFV